MRHSVIEMTISIKEVIDADRFPIFDRESSRLSDLVSQTSISLEDDGCAVLKNFIRPEYLDCLTREVLDVAHLAYDNIDDVNVYNTDVSVDYPPEHPAHIVMKRGNAFVARDLIGEDAIIAQLYINRDFKAFIARCFGLDRVYELGDPYAGLCANILRPGLEHPWHFDTNEFTVSMLTQAAYAGGAFEYCPNIRTPSAENMNHVSEILTVSGSSKIKRLDLRPGDLQLFKGRYSLHRVTEVSEDRDRHSAIFAYSEIPGVIGSATRTRQLFGRVAPEHLRAEMSNARSDNLMD